MSNDFPLPGYLRRQSDGLLLAVKLQPRAAANEIRGQIGDELRVRVTAPPVDSAANEALLRLLSELIDCPRSAVSIVRGHTSRHKLVHLRGLDPAHVLARLAD